MKLCKRLTFKLSVITLGDMIRILIYFLPESTETDCWKILTIHSRKCRLWSSQFIIGHFFPSDGLSHFAIKHLSENHQLELVKALTDLLGKTFPAQFVFPALGHDDPPFEKRLGKMWSKWLPTDSIKTFETGKFVS